MAAASPDAAPRRSPCAKSPIALRSACESFAPANVKFSVFCTASKRFGSFNVPSFTDDALSWAGRAFGRSKSSVSSLKIR